MRVRIRHDSARDTELPREKRPPAQQSGRRMSITVVRVESLPFSNIANEFVGDHHGVALTFLVVDAEAGRGPALHKHPYDEVIIVLDGQATLYDGIETHVVGAGEIVVIPAEQLHAFTNTGEVPLKQIDIHASPHFVTEWIDQERN